MDTPEDRRQEGKAGDPQVIEGKSSCEEESDQQGREGEQTATGTFFFKSVLRTQHEKIAPYPEPISDLLLAVEGQGQADINKNNRVYRKWIHLHGPNGEKV